MLLKLASCRRILCHPPRRRPASWDSKFTTSVRGNAQTRGHDNNKRAKYAPLEAAFELEKGGSRLLRVVRSKMEQRIRIMAEIEGEASQENWDAASDIQVQRSKNLKELEPLFLEWEKWNRDLEELRNLNDIILDSDPDMRKLAESEHERLIKSLSKQLSEIFPKVLIPPSKTTSLSALMELKAGAGGDEASLFLSEILRMYSRLASASGHTPELVSSTALEGSKGSTGGIRDAILEIRGEGAYDKFRWESGVHRVQRVPATETQGRVHTSTVAVVVLPTSQESASKDEADIVDPKDVRTDVMRSRGAGGQHVNRTESAIRLTHEPTGITVSMQDSRSQHQNRAKAWQILRARLLDRKMNEEMQQQRSIRRDLVRSSDRSEKIRTYNFPQDRLTDHRINYTVNNIPGVLEGDGLEEVINELQRNHQMSLVENLITEDNHE